MLKVLFLATLVAPDLIGWNRLQNNLITNQVGVNTMSKQRIGQVEQALWPLIFASPEIMDDADLLGKIKEQVNKMGQVQPLERMNQYRKNEAKYLNRQRLLRKHHSY